MRDVEKTIGNLIDKQSIVMVSSIDDDGYPNQKAMFAPRIREGIKTFYLTTNVSSLRTQQFLKNPLATLYFCDRRFFRGVMLRGTMEVLSDSNIKERMWQVGDTMYYPQGVTDPDYCILKFTCIDGRYYSQLKSENFKIEE